MRALLALGVLLAGCTSLEDTPEGTARVLLRAIEAADDEKLLELLAPRTRKKLEELARLATAQTGGRNQIEPRDLLVVGMYGLPGERSPEVKGVKVQGDRARVQLLGPKKVRRVLQLERVDGRWYVVLPDEMLRPPPPAAPASAPSSRPAAP